MRSADEQRSQTGPSSAPACPGPRRRGRALASAGRPGPVRLHCPRGGGMPALRAPLDHPVAAVDAPDVRAQSLARDGTGRGWPRAGGVVERRRSPGPGRSARLRRWLAARRCGGSLRGPAVELPRKEAAALLTIPLARRGSRFSRSSCFIRSRSSVVSPEDASRRRSSAPKTPPAVDLGQVDRLAQGLGADAELAGHARDRAEPLTRPAGALEDHPDGPLPELGRIPPLERAAVPCHDSVFLQAMESPSESGRFSLFRRRSGLGRVAPRVNEDTRQSDSPRGIGGVTICSDLFRKCLRHRGPSNHNLHFSHI